MTAKEWNSRLLANGEFVSNASIDSIKRDAREGWVPVEDIKPLVAAFCKLVKEAEQHEIVNNRDGLVYWHQTGETIIDIVHLQVEHPELFTI